MAIGAVGLVRDLGAPKGRSTSASPVIVCVPGRSACIPPRMGRATFLLAKLQVQTRHLGIEVCSTYSHINPNKNQNYGYMYACTLTAAASFADVFTAMPEITHLMEDHDDIARKKATPFRICCGGAALTVDPEGVLVMPGFNCQRAPGADMGCGSWTWESGGWGPISLAPRASTAIGHAS